MGVSNEAGPAPSGEKGQGLSTRAASGGKPGGNGLSVTSTSGHSPAPAGHKGSGVSTSLPGGGGGGSKSSGKGGGKA